MIEIVNKKCLINGNPVRLADSPESRLLYLDYRELDLLASIGMNAVSSTMYGDDVTSITPYISNNINNGFDLQKLQKWYDWIKYANNLGIVPFLFMSENKNHFNRTDKQDKDFIDILVSFFQDLSVCFTREEFHVGHDSFITTYFGYLKAKIKDLNANHIVAIHTDTDQSPYIGHNAQIDLVQLQTKLATGNSSITKAYNAGFAVFQSELVGGVSSSNVKQWCNLNRAMSSGAGAYFAADDLKAPQYNGTELKYKSVYEQMVAELGGTTPPPTNETITSKTFANSILTLNNKYNLQMTAQ